MSLSEFMPYGAPELLEGAAPRMARSTLLAAGIVAVLTWSAGIVAMRQARVVEVPPVPMPGWELQPPPRFTDEGGPREYPVPKTPILDPHTIVRPVDEEPPVEPLLIGPGNVDSNQPPGHEGTGSPAGL